MPSIDRQLAGDDGGAAAVAVIEDLQKVVTGGGVEWLETPIIEDEKIDAAERAQQAQMASVATGKRQIGEQPGDALIEHRAIVAASFVSESRSEPTLAHTGRAADEEIAMLGDPLPFGSSGSPVTNLPARITEKRSGNHEFVCASKYG